LTDWLKLPRGGGTAEPGERLKVVAVEGFHVIVRPLEEEKSAKTKTEKS
jgi:hypothetical protein